MIENKKAYNSLYNDEVVFQFHSNSAHRAPGKGSGEKIEAGRVSGFYGITNEGK